MNPEPAFRPTAACGRCERKESTLTQSVMLLLQTTTIGVWLLLVWLTVTLALPTASPWVQWLITLPLSIGTRALLTVCVSRLEVLSIFSCDTRMTPNGEVSGGCGRRTPESESPHRPAP